MGTECAREFVYEPGVVFASAAARALLEANGLLDLETVLARGEPVPGVIDDRHPERDVRRATLRDGDSESQVFVKRQLKRTRFFPRMAEVLHGVAFQSLLQTEWDSIRRLREAGLNTMQPLALFGRRWRPPGALIVRAVPPARSLWDLLKGGAVEQLPAQARETLAAEVAQVLHTIHAAGITWRGMDAKHFFPEQLGDGGWRIWLIDCCGAYDKATPRDRRRDRWKLLRHLELHGGNPEFARLVTDAVG